MISFGRVMEKLKPLWSQVASACSGWKQGFGSWSVTEVRSWQWEHRILATRPVVSDKALAPWLCRNEFPQRWKVVKQVRKQVFIRKKRVCVDRYMGRLRERVAPSWQFESRLWGISSVFPLANHFDLPVQSPYLVYLRIFPCVHMHLLAK